MRKFFAQIELAHLGVVHDVIAPALHQDLAGIDDIGAIGQGEGLAHIVVGDQNADAPAGQPPHQLLDFHDRLGIDARERLVEQHVIRPRGERPRDLDTAALAAGERDRWGLAPRGNFEFVEQRIELGLAPAPIGLHDFQHSANVVLHVEAAKDRCLLGQVADAEPCALIHWEVGDIIAIELDRAALRLDQAGNGIERRGLAGAIRPQQTDRFPATHVEGDPIDHLASAITLLQAMGGEIAVRDVVPRRRRRGRG